MRRARTRDEIKPLIELCKAGHLYEVQEWIAQGKPIEPAPAKPKIQRQRSPLEYAIGCGFHSLVQVLLEGGATVEYPGAYDALSQALNEKRFDIVQLLVKHGVDPKTADMDTVFETYDPSMMKYFIEHGADVEAGYPMARALCHGIRPSLGIYMTYKDRFKSFPEQLNIALRHHCKEGSKKWISLCLWAGADPYKPGDDDPDEIYDDEDGFTALKYAALYGHYDIFRMKRVLVSPARSHLITAIVQGRNEQATETLDWLLKAGIEPNDMPNGGCSAMQYMVSGLRYTTSIFAPGNERNISTTVAMEYMKRIHMLAWHGAKWRPEGDDEIRAARTSLLKMASDYTAEFVWIMSAYRAALKEDLEAMLRTPSIRAVAGMHWRRVMELVESLPTADG